MKLQSKTNLYTGQAWTALLLTSILLTNSIPLASLAKKRKRFKIPSPHLNISEEIKLAPGSEYNLEGKGFIKNHPQAHKFTLYETKDKNKVKKLKVLESEADSIKISIPEDLDYGDYKLAFQIKTKFFKSKTQISEEPCLIRPRAPEKPQLKYKAINKTSELENIIENQSSGRDLLSKELFTSTESELKLGKNGLRSFYIENGYESIRSEPSELYYLPEEIFNQTLEIRKPDSFKSENDLKANFEAIAHTTEGDFDLSSIVKSEKSKVKETYFIETPSRPKFLETQILRKLIYIKDIKVQGDESAIIRNDSPADLNLEGCILSDSIRKRFEFENNEPLKALSERQIEANLGLNDTSPDELSLSCPEENISSFTYKENLIHHGLLEELGGKNYLRLDRFRYSSVGENGLGIKL